MNTDLRIIMDLRKKATEGATICEIIEVLKQKLGIERLCKGTLTVYFEDGFHMQQCDATVLRVWQGVGGYLTDEELDMIFRPLLEHSINNNCSHQTERGHERLAKLLFKKGRKSSKSLDMEGFP